MYLLDTNVVSLFDPRRHARAADLLDWMRRNDRGLFVSVVTLMEIESGRLKLIRSGASERAVEIERLLGALTRGFGERVLAVDNDVALTTARLAAQVHPMVVDVRDLLIAATAKVHGFTVLTVNLRHFAPTGVPVLDPTAALPPDV